MGGCMIWLLLIVLSVAGLELTQCAQACRLKGRRVRPCTLHPETLMGQHFLAKSPHRQDVRDGEQGPVLVLTLIVVDYARCKPLPGIKVQIWHADPIGNYSQFAVNPVPNPSLDTRSGFSLSPSKSFLRGHQVTNAQGKVKFVTVFPGWIGGRTAHIHTNVVLDGVNHFGQIYFSEYLTQELTQEFPYTLNPWPRTPNSRDCEFLCYDGIATVANWNKARNHHKAKVVLGYNVSAKKTRARQLEAGVQCFKPDKYGYPHCKRIIATRNGTWELGAI